MITQHSKVTGQRTIRDHSPMLGSSVLLYDGALPVPVHECDASAVATFIGRNGHIWFTFVCCGPAAPEPRELTR
jgi:hypothetical protein